jgi:hypothetical protein
MSDDWLYQGESPRTRLVWESQPKTRTTVVIVTHACRTHALNNQAIFEYRCTSAVPCAI